ncbi:MAG: AMP-dependent synthetase/ligase [Kiritimatiellia bacterium]|jgi:long-chain acyl-CoA synthetase
MNIRQLFDDTVRLHGDSIAIQYKEANGTWPAIRYNELRGRVREVSELAGELGLRPRQDVAALVLPNRREWVEIYLGLACSGIIVLPLDPKMTPAEASFILKDAGAVAIFLEAKQRAGLEEILPGLPELRSIVWLDGAEAPRECRGRPARDYAASIEALYLPARLADSFYRTHLPADDDIASLLYTSGTTGKPKGAMITHANFCAGATLSAEMITFYPTDRFLVVLPLFHAFSFLANLVFPLLLGARLQFIDRLRTIAQDMRTLKPSVVMGVPLLFEKLLAGIQNKIATKPAAQFLLKIGLGRVVRRMIRKSLGGNLRLFVTGGAPCSPDMIRAYANLGVTVIEGYGLTECSPVVSITTPDVPRPGSIGLPLPRVEVRIANPDDQGVDEIEVRGPIVMKGYFRDPKSTAEVFTEDGFFRTGDLASRDDDGYLFIRGRVKALIVNREGKNIHPEEVELRLAGDPLVRDILVLGVREKGSVGEKVGAILVPDMDAVKAANGGTEPEWEEVESLLRKRLRDACAPLSEYKHPRIIQVRREPLERTAAQKIRRHVYRGALDTK